MIQRLLRFFQSGESSPPSPPPVHPRDISEEDLDYMRACSPFPETLDEVVEAGRGNIGFFPAHNNRAIEYPWLLHELRKPPVPTMVLDVGAGVNPIPFCLAAMGCRVTTIDAHPIVRTLDSKPGWNEWGFLDYSIIDPRIKSVHSTYEEFQSSAPFDVIYSASVIEHLPAVVRRAWTKRFSEQLVPGGRLLLTLDLKPNSADLWNLSEEKQVDDPAVHGSQNDLCDELQAAGFEIELSKFHREVKDSRIDTGLVAAVKSG